MAALRHPDAAIDEPRHFHLGRIDDPPAEGFDRAKPHRHDFFQVFWIRSGQGTVQSDLKRFPILPHTMFFVSPGQVHAWDLGADATGEFLAQRRIPPRRRRSTRFPGKAPFLLPVRRRPHSLPR